MILENFKKNREMLEIDVKYQAGHRIANFLSCSRKLRETAVKQSMEKRSLLIL